MELMDDRKRLMDERAPLLLFVLCCLAMVLLVSKDAAPIIMLNSFVSLAMILAWKSLREKADLISRKEFTCMIIAVFLIFTTSIMVMVVVFKWEVLIAKGIHEEFFGEKILFLLGCPCM